MNRDNLISRLVARKMESKQTKAGCVPCFGLLATPPAATSSNAPRSTERKN
ncbi:MAG: hypothetical protein U0792_06650 [Gemmataceae bacterium]